MSEERNLATVIDEYELDADSGRALMEHFEDVFLQVDRWAAQAKEIQVTDESQTHLMTAAGELRKQVKAKRVAVEAQRKSLKEISLRRGKAIDGVANIIKGLLEPLERHLKEQEDFVKVRREAEDAARRLKAEEALRLQEEKEQREAAEADAAERKRVAAENAQLRAEAEKREKAHAAELKRQQKAREKAEEAERAEREAERAEQEKVAKAAAAKAEKQRKIDVAAAMAKAAEEAEQKEAEHAEALRKARQVKCPKCGEIFDSTEHPA